MKTDLIEYLAKFAHDDRAELFFKNIEERTNHITLVLEDIHQAQNTSAAIRTCDCFGIQNIHVIENTNEFSVYKDITLGSSKWLNIKKYNEEENNTKACLDKLKSQGYKIVATTPLPNSPSIYDLDIDQKTALVFGNEWYGISDIVKQEADELVTIPMYGFTESFNISVSAAICLSELTTKIRKSNIDWQLSQEEKQETLQKWLTLSIKQGERIVKEYYEKFK